jgi:hypothetical protein
MQALRPLNSRHNAGPALYRGRRNLHAERLASRSVNIPLRLRRKSSRISPAAAATCLHPGLGRTTSMLIVRPATMVCDRARSYPARHQRHHQQNRPATPHGVIIGGTTLSYEKLEESMSSGAAHARHQPEPTPAAIRPHAADTPLRPTVRNQNNHAQCLQRLHALRLEDSL